ncbi:MAG: 1,4-dihydroxy-2-naphthoate octaprenyltransferase [Bacteroidales bacterium]|nr:1,4-dihydroxy-2-naphthoate octaprenyltransferase [Bacteroidales bacterium]
MKMTIKSCIKSMRLRTLPLSMAGIIAGTALASKVCSLDVPTVIALILTTAFLQILSNLSNELGDTLHGTDTKERQGIHYSIQDGEMTIPQMKKLIFAIVCLCCISGLAMVLFSFHKLFTLQPICLLVLGAAAIWAAMNYTLGENPYGYKGLGDIFVFIFFGIVSVMGAAYVCSHTLELIWALPASAFGCWSIGVLNVNNIRDMKTDEATRTTVALKLGRKNARIYQTALIAAGWILMLAYSSATADRWSQWIYLITLPLFAAHLRGVWTRVDRALDPMLPMLVMTAFITAILFAIGI